MKKIKVQIWLPLLLLALFVAGRYWYHQPSHTQGDTAPQFSATLLDGQPFALEDLRGQYVLLDFWGSWCGPCRQQNPALVALYQKYAQRTFADATGFTLVSVGIEEDAERWKRAIQRDGLIWPYHILDLTPSLRFFNSPVANIFGITQLPTTYFLAPDGSVIALNLPPDQVDRYLAQRLTN